MKHAIAVLAFFLVAATAPRSQVTWATPVYGWGSDWCQNCHTAMNVDIPNSGTGWTSYLAGWGFWCATGELPQRADVYYQNATTFQLADTYLTLHLSRPDVQAASSCPSTPSDTGWAIGFNTAVPSGTWTMSVVLWHGNVSTTQTGTVVVP